MKDVVIIGGGVIGLTTAHELAQTGLSVAVVDKQSFGKEASWAGAGMLPPGDPNRKIPEWDALFRSANALWKPFSKTLKDVTTIDNGYHQCGSIQFSLEAPEKTTSVESEIARWEEQGASVQRLDMKELQKLEPAVSSSMISPFELPETAQVRNPWHLHALTNACIRLGVESYMDEEIVRVNYENKGRRIASVESKNEVFKARHFIFCAGAWTGTLLKKHQHKKRCLEQEITPVLGQMLLLDAGRKIFSRILENGKRYLVPRQDGKVLIGSTEENCGFQKRNTVEVVQELLDFAIAVVPELKQAQFESSWSGLRPKSERGLPYLGALPDCENAVISAGHFRAGLQLSPVIAKLTRQLILQQQPDINLEPFAV